MANVHDTAMEPDTEPGHSSTAEQRPPENTNKRRVDSLFVPEGDNGEQHNAVEQDLKRVKLDNDSTYSSAFSSQTATTRQVTPVLKAPNPNPNPKPDRDGTQSQSSKTVTQGPVVPTVQDTKVPGLKSAKARRPQLAIFHPTFKLAEKSVPEVCNQFISDYKILKGKGFNNGEVEWIMSTKLEKWRSPALKYPMVRPVVFFGSAGAGKSSGANCYLDKVSAAVENDSGTRGTYIVHEYSGALPDQIAQYCVVARYLPESIIKKQIEKHCNAIFAWRKLTREDEDEIDDNDKIDIKNRHDTAMDFFSTLLRDREEFNVDEEDADYFAEKEGEPLEEVVQELFKFINDLLIKKGIVNKHMWQSFEAEDEEQLNSIFSEISGPPDDESSASTRVSTWPLISKVEVHLSNDLLDTGAMFGDAPGVSDTNQIVLDKTRYYLKEAGTIFVFTTPSRMLTCSELDANLRECIQLKKMKNTYVIVTMIDQKASANATDRSKMREDDRQKLDEAENVVQNAKTELEKALVARELLTNFDEYKARAPDIREKEYRIKAAEMGVQQVSVKIRNDKIERTVKNKFRELSGNNRAPDLKVIFTSNREYQKHLAGYDRGDPPMLDLDSTGIAKVQEVLYRVATSAKVRTLGDIINKCLPGAFNGIIGALTKSHMERKSEVVRLIQTVFDEEQSRVTEVVEELQLKFKDRVLETARANDAKWAKAAELKLQGWSKCKHPTFAAFCRRDGIWKLGKGQGLTNWNYEIQNIAASKFNAAFNALNDDIDSVESGLILVIGEQYVRLRSELEACEAFQGTDEKPFFDQIRRIKSNVEHTIGTVFEEFRAEVDGIRNKTTLNTAHNFVAPILRETYHECLKTASESYAPPTNYKDPKGKSKKRSVGAHHYRVQLLRERFTGEGETTGVFAAVTAEAHRVFQEVVKKYEDELWNQISSSSQDLFSDFNYRFGTAEVKSEDDPEAVETLKYNAKVALDAIQGEVKSFYDESIAYETAVANPWD